MKRQKLLKKEETEDPGDTMEEPFGETTCSFCYAEFLDVEDLSIHITQMHPATSRKPCQLCTATYTDPKNYAIHVRDTHLMDLRSCRYCTKVFLGGSKLKQHENKHDPTNALFSCSQCDAMFPETLLLELHERKSHDNADDGVFLECMPYLSSMLNFKVVPFLHALGKKIFKCCSCNFSSVSLDTYNKHLIDQGCQGFVCNRCSGVFKSKKYLLKHIKNTKKCISIEEYSDEATICKGCQKFVHPKAVELHAKTCQALKCVDCDFVCKTVEELSTHQSKEHPVGMNFLRCKYCAKEVIGESTLQKHIRRVHKPDFPLYKYQCKDCNAIFKHPQKLFAHFFTRHKEVFPFTCKICDKKFRVRKGFSLHIKLDHKSVGFVEFDDQYHVFFTANKSENPFIPECVIPPEEMYDSESEDAIDTDATNVETEDEKKPTKRIQVPKQWKSKRQKTKKKESVLVYSSDEEPLLEVRKRALKTRNTQKTSKRNLGKSLFTCDICNENCYTFQNHQNHMNTHNVNQELECVKCSQIFYSKDELTNHMSREHASSRLTETLKDILEKKKHKDSNGSDNLIVKSDKFTVQMTKVLFLKSSIPATIKPAGPNLSVRNFIENFTPDITDTTSKETVKIDTSVSIKPVAIPVIKKPSIKLTKFKQFNVYEPVPLKMPERFKRDMFLNAKVSIKLVQKPVEPDIIASDYDHNYTEVMQDFDDFDRTDADDNIPEMAHEVSLGTEEPPKQVQQTKIVIPKMPKGYNKIHIATLQPEAPYYKIIRVDSNKMEEVPEQKDEQQALKELSRKQNEVISLPGGTKLVTANPLAHLLKDTGDLVFEKTSYKPVIKDFPAMVARAMKKLEEPPPPVRKRRSKAKKAESSASIPT